MKKGRALDDVKAIKGVDVIVQEEWKNHYDPTESRLTSITEASNLLKWIDEQPLNEDMIIEDIGQNKEWKLIPLSRPAKSNDMSRKMTYDYMRNKFTEDGIPFMYSNKQDEEKDEWITKVIDDLNMYLDDKNIQNKKLPIHSNELLTKITSLILSPIPTPSLTKSNRNLNQSTWSIDLDASSVDAGSYLYWPPK